MFGIREHHRIILKKMIVNIYEYLKKINIFHHRLNNITKHIKLHKISIFSNTYFAE